MMQNSHDRMAESMQNRTCQTLLLLQLATATYSFSASPSGGTLEGATEGGSGSGQTIYSYCVSGPSNTCSPTNAGYNSVGNLLGYSDSVMGTWSFGYDSLNRLISGTPAASNTGNASNNGLSLCWSYDSFGNRTAESNQSGACPSASMATSTYNSSNQVTGTSMHAVSKTRRSASKDGLCNQERASSHNVRSRFLLKNNTLRSRFTMSTLNALLTSRRSVGALSSFAHRISDATNTKMYRLRGLALLALSLGVAASAQIPSVTDVTTPPVPGVGHDYIQENVETVNPSNGSLSIRIGVPLPKSRGVNIPFNFAYDSGSVYFLAQAPYQGSGFTWSTTWTPFSQGGWSYTVPMLSVQDSPFSGINAYPDGFTDPAVTCQMWTDYVFQDGSGQRTNLGIAFPENGENGCTTNNFSSGVLPQYDSPTGSGLIQNNLSTVLISQVGSTIAATNVAWGTEGSVNAVDVVSGDGTLYRFPSMQAPDPEKEGFEEKAGIATPSSITDRNGNTAQLVAGANGQPPFSYTDTIGRTALSISSFASTPYGDIVVVSGNLSYQIQWKAGQASFPITMTNLAAVNSTCTANNGGENQPVGNVVSSITLPNGQQYGFTYDPIYGLVNQITYPTGGYVVYSWDLNLQSEYGKFIDYKDQAIMSEGNQIGSYPTPNGGCAWRYDSPAIKHRYVYNMGASGPSGGSGPNGGQLVEQQDFIYNTSWNPITPSYWDYKQTTVVTTDYVQGISFKTVYTYGAVGPDDQPNTGSYQNQIPVETKVQYYGANGALLRTVNKVWANQRLMTQQTTTLASGQVSETDWTYNCNEMLAEKDEYGFGQGAYTQTTPGTCLLNAQYAAGSAPRGPLLRKTLYPSYHTFNNTIDSGVGGPVPQNILDKPDKVEVEDGNNTVEAGVSYTYDPNANLLSRSNWLNQTGMSALVTSHTYDSNGNMLTTTDPKNNLTRYSYADSFAQANSCSLPVPSNAYLTQITYPLPSSGVAQVKSFQYYCTTGELASSTDENLQTTTYIYNTPQSGCTTPDGFNRLSKIGYPDGGLTTYCYNDAAPNPTVQTTTLMNNQGLSKIALTELDGLGQSIQSQLSDSDGGTIYVDTVYDGVGHVNSVSNPYRLKTEPTYGLTMNTYDALGRPIATVHPDTSTSTWCYDGIASATGAANCSPQLGGAALGTWVDSTDENGNRWQRTSDSLGRLTAVMELGSSASPLNFETDYGYDALNNLMSVNQKGNGTTDVARTRKFSYDSLSRLIAASNPETASSPKPPSLTCTGASGSSWTTCYGYDQDSNLIYKTDNRGITMSFGYDALNRLLSKTYSDGATPSSCYQYDTASYGVGRLANAWTLSASSRVLCPTAMPFLTMRRITQYDVMGRIKNEQQLTLANHTSGYTPAYTYDLAGNLLTSTSGVAPAPTVSPILLTNTFNSAGRLQTVTSNLASNWTNGTGFPSALFALVPTQQNQNTSCTNQTVQYTAFGGLQNVSFGMGSTNTPAFTLNRNYDIRLRVNCENDTGPSTNPPTPGSAVVTISGVEQP